MHTQASRARFERDFAGHKWFRNIRLTPSTDLAAAVIAHERQRRDKAHYAHHPAPIDMGEMLA